jgi:hypothetical protein
MHTTRKFLVLPLLAVASASVVLLSNLGLSAASVPTVADTESIKVAADAPAAGSALSLTNWRETAGSNTKGTPGGPNGTVGCPIKR